MKLINIASEGKVPCYMNLDSVTSVKASTILGETAVVVKFASGVVWTPKTPGGTVYSPTPDGFKRVLDRLSLAAVEV